MSSIGDYDLNSLKQAVQAAFVTAPDGTAVAPFKPPQAQRQYLYWLAVLVGSGYSGAAIKQMRQAVSETIGLGALLAPSVLEAALNSRIATGAKTAKMLSALTASQVTDSTDALNVLLGVGKRLAALPKSTLLGAVADYADLVLDVWAWRLDALDAMAGDGDRDGTQLARRMVADLVGDDADRLERLQAALTASPDDNGICGLDAVLLVLLRFAIKDDQFLWAAVVLERLHLGVAAQNAKAPRTTTAKAKKTDDAADAAAADGGDKAKKGHEPPSPLDIAVQGQIWKIVEGILRRRLQKIAPTVYPNTALEAKTAFRVVWGWFAKDPVAGRIHMFHALALCVNLATTGVTTAGEPQSLLAMKRSDDDDEENDDDNDNDGGAAIPQAPTPTFDNDANDPLAWTGDKVLAWASAYTEAKHPDATLVTEAASSSSALPFVGQASAYRSALEQAALTSHAQGIGGKALASAAGIRKRLRLQGTTALDVVVQVVTSHALASADTRAVAGERIVLGETRKAAGGKKRKRTTKSDRSDDKDGDGDDERKPKRPKKDKTSNKSDKDKKKKKKSKKQAASTDATPAAAEAVPVVATVEPTLDIHGWLTAVAKADDGGTEQLTRELERLTALLGTTVTSAVVSVGDGKRLRAPDAARYDVIAVAADQRIYTGPFQGPDWTSTDRVARSVTDVTALLAVLQREVVVRKVLGDTVAVVHDVVYDRDVHAYYLSRPLPASTPEPTWTLTAVTTPPYPWPVNVVDAASMGWYTVGACFLAKCRQQKAKKKQKAKKIGQVEGGADQAEAVVVEPSLPTMSLQCFGDALRHLAARFVAGVGRSTLDDLVVSSEATTTWDNGVETVRPTEPDATALGTAATLPVDERMVVLAHCLFTTLPCDEVMAWFCDLVQQPQLKDPLATWIAERLAALASGADVLVTGTGRLVADTATLVRRLDLLKQLLQ
jgi:hypothetical protein